MDSPLSSSPSLLLARQRLPITPGVYIFKNAQKQVIYVGKAKNLKSRVTSYFQPPIRLGPKTSLLVQNIATLEYIQVNSETEALLLESRLIKKFKPQFNIASKDDKSPYYIHLTSEAYSKPIINHEAAKSLAGPFLNGLIPRRILKQFRRVAPYCIAPRPVTKPCFYSHLGLCHPCPGENLSPQLQREYKSNIRRLKKLLLGQFSTVSKQLAKDMAEFSQNQNFEQAALVRDQLSALTTLSQTPISPDEYLSNPNLVQDTQSTALTQLISVITSFKIPLTSLQRIEVYDNAHLAGNQATSAMVVAENGSPTHSQYRHFKIRTAQSNSDVDMMVEILNRRLKRTDWNWPNLIVLDGGLPQLSALKQVQVPPQAPPVIFVALAKKAETLLIPTPTGQIEQVNLPLNSPALNLVQTLRNEAHRFSRRLHHKLRSKSLLG